MFIMDEIKFNVCTKFMRAMAYKLIAKCVKKYFNCDVDVNLEELKFAYVDGKIVLKTDVEIKMNKDDIKKVMTKINK